MNFVNQKIKKKPPLVVHQGNKVYNLVKKCNDTLFLYEEETMHYKTTFDIFQLGMVEAPDEKPNNKPHRIKF